jgi:cytochrome c-type biogenesis protein CcmH/NrfG
LLLDRRRIRKWGKWVALGLAIIFAISFVGIGVGGNSGNGSVFESLSCSKQQATADSTPQQKIQAYQTTLASNPNDTTALLGLATQYEGLPQPDYASAAAALERVIAIDPSQKDVYMRLARDYESVTNYSAAATVLNKATTVDPNNPDIFLQLGIVQNDLGSTKAAVLAWQKYLQLAPNGDMAQTVKDQIAKLTATTTTTASGSSTSSTAQGASTTAGGTGASTTTSAAASTTTAGTTPTTAAAATTSSAPAGATTTVAT